ncbi:hypothetical protein EIP91_008391 [Steccherinum ochraceum]|uniref:Uncharacterized protein n=1 Tax=Steccherinum ochraceum TaxID=92696 RepID=A0A4R0RGM3_9APHY|nr:hypothetical protein EIP91_008391 [Steccherinum ochraceum]
MCKQSSQANFSVPRSACAAKHWLHSAHGRDLTPQDIDSKQDPPTLVLESKTEKTVPTESSGPEDIFYIVVPYPPTQTPLILLLFNTKTPHASSPPRPTSTVMPIAKQENTSELLKAGGRR